ncbi:Sirohydrochlorin ferrochelatase [Amycolatopsis arida]|uniref:Sirohydrochlorin ferrochelatase n=1 Tax=Amycolatopsis arida TaxID=587909 RepID=A0A1I5UW03_9PSEU|nr:sirohydrochlorin chelatase [Amycolatopsis arida]TDX91055.1 sirohydrochlorin ferrochelatase [Amycolatopsis arida]SFP99435.1 Sirohydrochlorin ferrochelatase [Amycolatopsis arida]
MVTGDAGGAPPLVAVAHGSRDPHSAATIRALVDVVRALAPGLEVRPAFLDLSEPSVPDVLTALHGDGHREAVVVPLLLGTAYHARVDLPALVDQVTTRSPRLRVSVTDVLGHPPALAALALDRLVAAGADLTDPELGIVLAAVGSSHAAANDVVRRLARHWATRNPVAGVVAAFASAAKPDVPAAIAKLRAMGARRFAVASWFLAPGLLPDRIATLARHADPAIPLAAPLGADTKVAHLVLQRYAEATATAATRPA